MMRKLACVIVATFALAQPALTRSRTCRSRTDTARTIIARLFLQRSPAYACSRPQRPKRSGAQGTGVFIDVLPRAPKPQNLPAGTVWRDKPRLNIPGSVWLPDTGYGKLAEATEDYLRRGT